MEKFLEENFYDYTERLNSVSSTTVKKCIYNSAKSSFEMNDMFIECFKDFIDKSEFTKYDKLTKEMIDKYPELFDKDILKSLGDEYLMLHLDILDDNDISELISRIKTSDNKYSDRALINIFNRTDVNSRKEIANKLSCINKEESFIEYLDESIFDDPRFIKLSDKNMLNKIAENGIHLSNLIKILDYRMDFEIFDNMKFLGKDCDINDEQFLYIVDKGRSKDISKLVNTFCKWDIDNPENVIIDKNLFAILTEYSSVRGDETSQNSYNYYRSLYVKEEFDF